jgi:protein O-mannosyl-transferase
MGSRGTLETVASSPPHGRPPVSRWLVPALPPLAALVAFSSALVGGFQQWDDVVLLVDNPAYRGLSWSHLRWMFTADLMGHYMPLTWLTYGVDYVLWGLRSFGYHLTSIALHVANVTLVYLVTLWILRRARQPARPDSPDRDLRLGAMVAALIFGVHPLRVESVAWITERRDVLCGLLCLLAVLLYLRAVDPESEGGRMHARLYWAAVVAFALALLAKSMAVTLPAVLLVLDVYPLRRLRAGARGWLTPGPWRVWREKVPFVLLAAAFTAGAFRALHSGAAATSWERLGLLERVALSAYSIVFYLRKTLLPVGLSPLYELSLPVGAFDRSFILSGAVVLLMTLAALGLRRRIPGFLTAWTCYVVVLLPVAGIFHNGYQIAADRYTYLPGVAWAVLGGGGFVAAWARIRGRRPLATAAILGVSALFVVLVVATWRQSTIWRDDETLWGRAVQLDPASSIAASNFGSALRARGRVNEAIEHSRRALVMRPDYPQAHLNLGLAMAQQGRPAEAEAHFRRVLAVKPQSVSAHVGLGSALEAQGRQDEAFEQFRLAVRIEPGSARPHNDFGVALARRGRTEEALAEFREAVRLDPDSAQVQNNLGLALAQSGRLTEAADHFRAAIGSDPGSVDARRNLDYTLRLLGR